MQLAQSGQETSPHFISIWLHRFLEGHDKYLLGKKSRRNPTNAKRRRIVPAPHSARHAGNVRVPLRERKTRQNLEVSLPNVCCCPFLCQKNPIPLPAVHSLAHTGRRRRRSPGSAPRPSGHSQELGALGSWTDRQLKGKRGWMLWDREGQTAGKHTPSCQAWLPRASDQHWHCVKKAGGVWILLEDSPEGSWT